VLSLSISKGSVGHIIGDFGYSKLCLRCGPPIIAVKYRTESKAISSESLTCIETEGMTLSWIVTAGETWFHHFELEMKCNLWNGTILSLPENEKKSASAGKVMITVSWDCEGVILVDAMLKVEIINFHYYIRTVTELRKHLRRVGPHKNTAEYCFSMTVQGCTQV
jgi:hypothetical protein